MSPLLLLLLLGAAQEPDAGTAVDSWAMVRWTLPMPGAQRGSDMWYRRPVRVISEDGPILQVEGITALEYGTDGAVVRYAHYVEQLHCGTTNLRPVPPPGEAAEPWGPPPPEFSPPYDFIRAVCDDKRPYDTAAGPEEAIEKSAEYERQWRRRVEMGRLRP